MPVGEIKESVLEIINTILGKPLGWVMYFCYNLVQNYGLTIILFTIISKLILLPISLLVQKNSIKMVKLQPEIDEIKKLYAGDKERIGEEQYKLFEREGYNPGIGCLPTIIQIPIILGLIQVIYHPLQHLFRVASQTAQSLIQITGELLNKELTGNSAELQVIEAIQNNSFTEAIRNTGLLTPETFEKIRTMQLNFLGIRLSEIPSLKTPNATLLIPLISGLSALALCLYQDRNNVLQREQGKLQQWGMTIFLVLFSLYFTFLVPAGIGLYWICSNLLAIVQLAILNKIYAPEKYIDYESRNAKKAQDAETSEEARIKHEEERKLQLRERDDIERFYNTQNKLVVFYSEKSGFYNYFAEIIEYLLRHTKIIIHYVTGDPEDQVFRMNEPNLIPYYVSDRSLGSFFAQLDVPIVVMTMPDLQTYHIKRSVVRKDIEYIYVFHALMSTTMAYRKGAFDHFDTIFTVGPYQIREIRENEQKYDLKPKKLIEHGYGQLDRLLREHEQLPERNGDAQMILIAPSHHPGNILESCIEELVERLYAAGYKVVVRPHPQYVKRNPDFMPKLEEKFSEKIGERLVFETNFSSHTSIYSADLLITDWSGTAFEYSYVTKRPTLFINTPMKVINPEYDQYENKPMEISFRKVGGISIDPDEVPEIENHVRDVFVRSDEFHQTITEFMEENVFNIGHSGQNGAKYIVSGLLERKNKK